MDSRWPRRSVLGPEAFRRDGKCWRFYPPAAPLQAALRLAPLIGRRGEELVYRRELERVRAAGHPAPERIFSGHCAATTIAMLQPRRIGVARDLLMVNSRSGRGSRSAGRADCGPRLLSADVYFVCQFKTYEYLNLFFENVQICDSAALRGRDHPDMPEPLLRPARRADGGRLRTTDTGSDYFIRSSAVAGVR